MSLVCFLSVGFLVLLCVHSDVQKMHIFVEGHTAQLVVIRDVEVVTPSKTVLEPPHPCENSF